MIDNIKNKLSVIVRSQEFIGDDKLSKMIRNYTNSELSENELELVVAASKSDYQRFCDYIKLKGIDIS